MNGRDEEGHRGRGRPAGGNLLAVRLDKAMKLLRSVQGHAERWKNDDVAAECKAACEAATRAAALVDGIIMSGWTPRRLHLAPGSEVTLTERGKKVYGPLFDGRALHFVAEAAPGLVTISDGLFSLPLPRRCIRGAALWPPVAAARAEW